MQVYIVCSTFDELLDEYDQGIESIWLNKKDAEERAKVLNENEEGYSPWEVSEYEVNE